jgi:hypothetical protein
MSLLYTRRPLSPERCLVVNSVRGLTNPGATVRLQWLGKLKKNYLIGNPQPCGFYHTTATYTTPRLFIMQYLFDSEVTVGDICHRLNIYRQKTDITLINMQKQRIRRQ